MLRERIEQAQRQGDMLRDLPPKPKQEAHADMTERMIYVQWVAHKGLSHDERMALVEAGDHHSYFGELVEVDPGDAFGPRSTRGVAAPEAPAGLRPVGDDRLSQDP